PTSGGLTERQVMLMQDFGTTVLCCTPSYSLTTADVAQEMKMDIRDLKLRVGIFGAEPWSDQMRVEIEQRLNLKAVDVYGLTEVIGPGVSAECEVRSGLHIYEDHFIPEIIDPVTGNPLPEGQTGELVFTTITKEAFPVIRFRTRDITQLTREACSCGRTLVRMNRVSGRTDDMLIIRGVNVFPSQIESVLIKFEEVAPQYQLIVWKEGHLDTLTVYVEAIPGLLTGSSESIEETQKKIQDRIRGYLGITIDVKLVEPKSIERSIGKAKRVIDERPKN
ncbi:MAG: AMP-binding protein, partial [Nitrospira sp.]|nr:AMP-binding protein [Nitrospira sp.]